MKQSNHRFELDLQLNSIIKQSNHQFPINLMIKQSNNIFKAD